MLWEAFLERQGRAEEGYMELTEEEDEEEDNAVAPTREEEEDVVIRAKGKGGGKAGLTDDALPDHFLIDIDQYTATRVGFRLDRVEESTLKLFDARVHSEMASIRGDGEDHCAP